MRERRSSLLSFLRSFQSDHRGVTALEYALLTAAVAIAYATVAVKFESNLKSKYFIAEGVLDIDAFTQDGSGGDAGAGTGTGGGSTGGGSSGGGSAGGGSSGSGSGGNGSGSGDRPWWWPWPLPWN